ncbi:MAG: hypothetical protein GY869_01200, partial [Planctomycetes bacterium]|nr:hypothetical protein [Planctomycetota bacterium]
RLSNDPDFTNSIWQPYQFTMTWLLSEGDGLKTIYAQFRDPQDNESVIAQNSITLDTRADIQSLTVRPTEVSFSNGDSIHFEMITGELNGQAIVSIGQVITDIVLFDDGNHGDGTADNGIYETDYIVPTGIEVVAGVVVGNFIDRAGNAAVPQSAVTTITIQQPPQAVIMNDPIVIGTSFSSLRLTWSANTDSDFSAYQLYRRLAPQPQALTKIRRGSRSKEKGAARAGSQTPARDDTTFVLIEVITNQGTTSFDDTDLETNTTYQYRIDVVDSDGIIAPSNIVTGQTSEDLAPLAVTITSVSAVTDTDDQLQVTWIPNEEDDFFAYELFRAGFPDFSDSILIDVIDDQTENQFTDENLQSSTVYYYRIICVDLTGQSTAGNIAPGTTNTNLPPDPVTILAVSPVVDTDDRLRIFWTESFADDFQSYELYRDFNQDVDQSSILVETFDNSATTQFDDSNLMPYTEYFYRIYVRDYGDSTSGSNVVSGTTLATVPPLPVNLLQVAAVENTFDQLQLTWTASTEDDFEAYHVYRSLDPDFSDATFVDDITSVATTTYIDQNLEQAMTYYYQIHVLNTAQLTTPSNTLGGTTNENLPPLPVTIYDVSAVTGTDDQLLISWTASEENDFLAYQLFRSETG